MRIKAILTIVLVTVVFAFSTAAQSGEKTKKKRHGSGKTSEQTTNQQGTPNQGPPATGTPPPPPSRQPGKPEKIKRVGSLGDIRMESVWLDSECRINFKLRNKGKWRMSSLEHMKGVVRVYVGDEYEDFWVNRISKKGKKAVDLAGALKRPRAMVSYDTEIKLSKAEKVSVVFLPSTQLSRLRLSQVKGRGQNLIPRCLPAGGGDDRAHIPTDQPASADSGVSRPAPDFGDSESSTPRVQVIEPNGGEFWEECSLGRVRWRYFGPASDLPEFWRVYLYNTSWTIYGYEKIRSSECCVHVMDTRGNYYECTKSLAGPCMPEGDYEILVESECPFHFADEPDSCNFLSDQSDDPFQIGMSEDFESGDVRIRGFYFTYCEGNCGWLYKRRSVYVGIDVSATRHGLEVVEIEFRGHNVFRIETTDDRYSHDHLFLSFPEYATENGTYQLRAYAEDREGNSDSHTLNLTVDLDAPTMTIHSPREGDIFYADFASGKANVNFDITASDDISGEVDIYIGEGSGTSVIYDLKCLQSPCRHSLKYPIGEHSVRIRTLDRARNEVEQSVTFTVRSAADRPAGME